MQSIGDYETRGTSQRSGGRPVWRDPNAGHNDAELEDMDIVTAARDPRVIWQVEPTFPKSSKLSQKSKRR